MLSVEGRLSLDDDIRTYLPELPDLGATVTLRHLLHHRSGLRDQWNLLGLAGWRLDDVITRDQIMRLLTRQRDLNFAPGAEYLYCNTGFTLLALIVERVTGRPFPEWTAEHIFQPLGMTRTHFHDDHEMIVPDRAYSYANGPDGYRYRKSVLSYANAGATSLFTTVSDLSRWMYNLQTGRVGGREVVDLVHTRGVLNNGDTLDYAFGLALGAYRGLRTVGHGGADAGFRSDVVRFPDQGLSVAVLANLGGINSSELSRGVAAIYLEDEMEPAAPRTAGAVATADTSSARVRQDVVEPYLGQFDLLPGLQITFTLVGDRLAGQATGQRKFFLRPRSDSVFVIPEVAAVITFLREANGDVNRFILDQGGRRLEAKRVGTYEGEPVDLSQYVGDFESPELETTYHLVVRDDTLRAEHVRHDPTTLRYLAPDRFRGNVWFFGETRFERDASGTVTGFRVSNGRVRNLLFVRRSDGGAQP